MRGFAFKFSIQRYSVFELRFRILKFFQKINMFGLNFLSRCCAKGYESGTLMPETVILHTRIVD